MKLIYTFIMLLCTCFMQAAAQSAISLGPEAGFTLSQVRYKEKGGVKVNPTPQLGFQAGLSVNYRLGKTSALKTGLQFDRLNTSTAVQLGSTQDEYWTKLNSDLSIQRLAAPLALQWSPFQNSKFSLYFSAGGQIAYLLKMTENFYYESMTLGYYERVSGNNELQANMKRVNRLQFSATLGTGLRVKTGPGFLNAELSYLQGINKIGKGSSPVHQLSSVCMNFGYFFNL